MGQVELSGDYTDLEKVIKEFHISLGIFLFERLILPLLLFLLYINQIPDVYRSIGAQIHMHPIFDTLIKSKVY